VTGRRLLMVALHLAAVAGGLIAAQSIYGMLTGAG